MKDNENNELVVAQMQLYDFRSKYIKAEMSYYCFFFYLVKDVMGCAKRDGGFFVKKLFQKFKKT